MTPPTPTRKEAVLSHGRCSRPREATQTEEQEKRCRRRNYGWQAHMLASQQVTLLCAPLMIGEGRKARATLKLFNFFSSFGT